MTKHHYIIVVRYLDGSQHGYAVNMTDEKSYRHQLALHKMRGVRSVAVTREPVGE